MHDVRSDAHMTTGRMMCFMVNVIVRKQFQLFVHFAVQ